MEKVKVKKDVFEALNFIFDENNFKAFKDSNGDLDKNGFLRSHSKVLIVGPRWRQEVSAINEIGLYDLALILEHGYELEESPTEELARLYNETNYSEMDRAFNKGINYTLEKLGIKIKGINE